MDLHPGEEIVFEGHPSWRGVLSFYVYGIGAAVIVGIVIGVAGETAIGSIVAVVGHPRRRPRRLPAADRHALRRHLAAPADPPRDPRQEHPADPDRPRPERQHRPAPARPDPPRRHRRLRHGRHRRQRLHVPRDREPRRGRRRRRPRAADRRRARGRAVRTPGSSPPDPGVPTPNRCRGPEPLKGGESFPWATRQRSATRRRLGGRVRGDDRPAVGIAPPPTRPAVE